MAFEIVPVGFVKNARREIKDDRWGEVISEIELAPEMEDDALVGLEAFSHVEVVFAFHKVPADRVVCGSRHPRGNTGWPRVGIFAQRGGVARIGSALRRRRSCAERAGRSS